jgi:acetylornithine deacetylase/succinyl-diaminopimelate desuccinylase-like protein
LRSHPKVVRIALQGGGYNAVRASMDLPISRKVIAAVESVRGPVLKMPTQGGSLPMAVFEELLQKPLIIVPIVNHDNNQHSHNENLLLRNLWEGIETMSALMTME